MAVQADARLKRFEDQSHSVSPYVGPAGPERRLFVGLAPSGMCAALSTDQPSSGASAPRAIDWHRTRGSDLLSQFFRTERRPSDAHTEISPDLQNPPYGIEP